MLKLFKKKEQKNEIQDDGIMGFIQRIATHAINGGTTGVNIAVSNEIIDTISNWAKLRKEKGEIVTKEILLAKMKKEFFGNKFAKAYSNMLGYNEKTIDQLADNVLANI